VNFLRQQPNLSTGSDVGKRLCIEGTPSTQTHPADAYAAVRRYFGNFWGSGKVTQDG